MSVALLLIDVQYDFIDGSLAVKDAASILPTVHDLLDNYAFPLIVASQDWHPPRHISFASSHPPPNNKPFTSIDHVHPAQPDQPIKQELWPDHCVQGTRGAAIERSVADRLERLTPGCLAAAGEEGEGGEVAERRQGDRQAEVLLVQKGTEVQADGYSAFSLNGYLGFTPLARRLFAWNPPTPPPSSSSVPSSNFAPGIDTVVICGLATDYCCLRTAIDARKLGFRTIVVDDGMRGVSEGTISSAWREMERWGCIRVKTAKDAWQLATAQS
ncbi:hypothetical protein OC844_003702 [Tilletia horrida]|nr:hypothetical protein OC844_003702 [Tilletia horrida]